MRAGKAIVDVPDGDYYIALRLVRPLGDSANPTHVEPATLNTFTIDRP